MSTIERDPGYMERRLSENTKALEEKFDQGSEWIIQSFVSIHSMLACASVLLFGLCSS